MTAFRCTSSMTVNPWILAAALAMSGCTGLPAWLTGGDDDDSVSSSGDAGLSCTLSSDCPAAGSCRVPLCASGACTLQDAPVNTACADNGGKVCNGSGACVGCTTATHCPTPENECQQPACTAGQCIPVNATDGMPTLDGQTPGDCHKRVCTSGTATVITDDSDPMDDANPCTEDRCQDGVNLHTPTAGSCAVSGGKVCGTPAGTHAGQCVQCNQDTECTAPKVCDPVQGTGTCVDPTCTDGSKDGTETDVDCGGSCGPCPDTRACGAAADCQSGFCSTGTCAPCAENTQCQEGNHCDLTGGVCRPNLPGGDTCTQDAQCGSGHCVDQVCCDTECQGTCDACSAAKKGQGANGTCGPILTGTDPDAECDAESTASCGRTGACNGASACALHGAGTVCVPASCTAGTAQPAQTCNGTGVCVASAPVACGLLVCNPEGTACLETCTADQDCASAADFCQGTTCTAKHGQATVCTGARECASGSCTDGLCCAVPCSGVCQACNLPGLEGLCSPIPAGTDPVDECAGTALCDGSATCVQPAGTACAAGAECLGGSCVDGVCCSSACGGPCQACNVVDHVGSCVDVPAGTDPAAECPGETTCNGTGNCTFFTDGTACTLDLECTSGHCVDSVCCDTACDGTCEACSATAKGQGADGVCGPIQAGTDPGDECEAATPASCGLTGECNGAGACLHFGPQSVCQAASCQASTLHLANTCNGAGACVDRGTQTCSGGLTCNANGTACLAVCAADADCVAGYFCNGNACAPKQTDGAACSGANACSSGLCVDGVCCDTACAGTCQACSAAKKGNGADGTCGSIAASTDPDNECADSGAASCGTIGVCNGAGACALYASGTVCQPASCSGSTLQNADTCDGSGTCTDSGTTSCGAYTCNAGGTACLTTCATDTACTAGNYCSGVACVPKASNGSVCPAANACTSGNCVDGVCCDTACSGSCQACSAAKKGGGADGVCGSIAVSTDPDNECTATAMSTCGADGTCNGAGACALYAAGTVCQPASCSGSTLQNADTCDGSGTCTDSGTTSCGAYTCNAGGTACLTTCATDTQCTAGNYCSGGACVPKASNGSVCPAANACTSGNCVDGVCCNSACSGLCQACSAVKTGGVNGTCGSIAASTDPDNECAATGTSTCGTNGTCNGAGACARYAAGTVCVAASCSGSTLQNADTCNGSGTCTDSGTTSCGAYTCNAGGTACLTTCATDTQCTAGTYCNAGSCVPKLPSGTVCAGASACISGMCVDGVCCTTACGGTCQACSAAKTGGSNGTCGNIVASTDPDNECVGATTCNGTGTCTQLADGTSCTLAAECLGGYCFGSPKVCHSNPCGDGTRTGSEACDDGNNTTGDGCSSTCAVESGFTCSGSAPSVCTAICGDGQVRGSEACDDGNTANGDGCSSTCTTENSYLCTGAPSVCTLGTCPTVIRGPVSYAGYTWFHGTRGQSCDAVCAAKGMVYSTGTQTYAGSSGSLAQCGNVITAFGFAAAPGAYGCAQGWGCLLYENGGHDFWRCGNPATTSAASLGYICRFCACQ